jgi:hypothetical protein
MRTGVKLPALLPATDRLRGTEVLVSLAVCAALAACSTEKPERTPSAGSTGGMETNAGAQLTAAPSRPALPPLDSGLVFRLRVDSANASHPTLELETNLPDGTEIMFGLERRRAADYPMQSKSTVRGGLARSEAFGPSEGLRVGEYEADATMPYSVIQPPEVQAVIGPEGEGLRGKGVTRDKMGTTVSASVRFTVGGRYAGAVAAREGDAAVGSLLEVIASIDSLVRAGRSMEPYRRTDDRVRIRSCGERMRTNLARHEVIDRRITGIPNAAPGRIEAFGALASARRCVTCVDDAGALCRDAATQLGEARRVIDQAASERKQ